MQGFGLIGNDLFEKVFVNVFNIWNHLVANLQMV